MIHTSTMSHCLPQTHTGHTSNLTVCDCCCCGLVDDPLDIQASNDTSVLGGLPLSIIEVGWDSDHCMLDGLAQVLLCSRNMQCMTRTRCKVHISSPGDCYMHIASRHVGQRPCHGGYLCESHLPYFKAADATCLHDNANAVPMLASCSCRACFPWLLASEIIQTSHACTTCMVAGQHRL